MSNNNKIQGAALGNVEKEVERTIKSFLSSRVLSRLLSFAFSFTIYKSRWKKIAVGNYD
jgi:hypothetical protein